MRGLFRVIPSRKNRIVVVLSVGK